MKFGGVGFAGGMGFGDFMSQSMSWTLLTVVGSSKSRKRILHKKDREVQANDGRTIKKARQIAVLVGVEYIGLEPITF